MGAGARFAAERDRWPEHWRVADLDMEEDGLLAVLEPAEELRAVIPGMRMMPSGGEEQVLIGVTDRRVVLVGRHSPAGREPLRVIDVTQCAATAPREGKLVPHVDGHLAFDVDEESMSRVWAQIDDVARHGPAPD